MFRQFPRAFGLALLAAAPLALMSPSGCADNKSTMFVRHVLAVPEDCLFEPDPDSAFIGSGVLDIVMRGSYAPFVLIGNQLVPQGDDDQLKTETSRIALKGAEVTLSVAGGDPITTFSTTCAGTVDPAPGAEAGYGVTQVTMIPPGLDLAPGDYLAAITVFGETLGNEDVETSEFVFPINVCEGCLIFFNQDSIAAGVCVPDDDPVGTCLTGQDGPVDCGICQTVSGGSPLCGAP
jgi:hypothetical protein